MSLELNPLRFYFEQAKPERIRPVPAQLENVVLRFWEHIMIEQSKNPLQNTTLLYNAFVVTVSTCNLHVRVEPKKRLKAFDTGIVIALVIPSR